MIVQQPRSSPRTISTPRAPRMGKVSYLVGTFSTRSSKQLTLADCGSRITIWGSIFRSGAEQVRFNLGVAGCVRMLTSSRVDRPPKRQSKGKSCMGCYQYVPGSSHFPPSTTSQINLTKPRFLIAGPNSDVEGTRAADVTRRAYSVFRRAVSRYLVEPNNESL